jgi:hypothetical protein
VIVAAFVALSPPANPPVTTGALQLYKVPPGTMPSVTSVGVTLNITPLQVVVLNGFTVADGFNVTVTVNVDPDPQLTVLGVTI